MSLMKRVFSELMMWSKMKTAKWLLTEDRREAEAREVVLVSLEKKATSAEETDQRKPPEESKNSLKS